MRDLPQAWLRGPVEGIEMFRKIPIRARDLVALFFLRTAILVPALALWVVVLERVGLFR